MQANEIVHEIGVADEDALVILGGILTTGDHASISAIGANFV